MIAAPRAGRSALSTSTLLDNIGDTPLIRLAKVTADLPGIEIYGKAEYFNPGGSVKDRPAARMIAEGEKAGTLTPGKILIDATSGNTGIAYAMIAAAKGIPVRLCLPSNASPERKRILQAYGADIVFTDPGEGSDGAIRKCREIYQSDPGLYFYPDQYNNPANWRAHFDTTGARDFGTNRRAPYAFCGGCSEPAARSWERRGTCGRRSGRCSAFRRNRRRAFTAWKG